MKLSKLLMLVLISSFIGLVSCDEEASSPTASVNPTIQDYFPLTVGSWWTYDNYETDESGNKTADLNTDSTYVSAIATIRGFEAYEIITVSTFGDGTESIDTTYSRYEGSKVMTVFSGYEEFPDIDIEWFVSADLENSSWIIFDDNFGITIEGIDMELDILMTGSKGSESTHSYLNQSYKSISFMYDADIELTGEFMGEQFTQSSNTSATLIHAEGIGIVKENETEFEEDMGDTYEFYNEKVLTAYHIAE